jgi:hypothetical protein
MAVRPYAPAVLYPPGRFVVLISVRGWVDPRGTVRMKELGKLKKSTSSGLDPATFRLAAQCLNQLRYCVTPKLSLYLITIPWRHAEGCRYSSSTPGVHLIGGYVSPRAGLNAVEKTNILLLAGIKPQPSSPYPVAILIILQSNSLQSPPAIQQFR